MSSVWGFLDINFSPEAQTIFVSLLIYSSFQPPINTSEHFVMHLKTKLNIHVSFPSDVKCTWSEFHVLGEHHGFVVMYILGAHALGVPVEGL